MYERAIALLERFNKKAEILNKRGFIAALRGGKGHWSIEGKVGIGSTVTYDFPEEEELHAFLLTARLFDQRRDRISLDCIAELYDSLPVPQRLKDRVHRVREGFTKYLDALSPLVLEQEQIRRRLIFDVLLYGGHAHANDDKEPLFDKWTSDEFLRVLTESEFIGILAELTQAVFWIRQVNLEALECLRGGGDGQAPASNGT